MVNVSIIIPHFNRFDYLKQTLASIMYQTYKDWEAIIVDDYSKPECLAEIQLFIQEVSNITLVTKTTEPKGASVSRNMGLEKATGDYVLFLDADDLLAPFALEQRIKVFENNNVHLDAVMAPTLVFNTWPGDCQKVWHPFDGRTNPLNSFIAGDSYFNTMSGLWDKAFLKKIGGWNNHLTSYQDWEFHVRALLQNLRYKEVQEYDNFYRKASDDQSIAGNFFREDIAKGRFQAFQIVYNQLTNLKKVKLLKPFRAFVIRQLVHLIDHDKKQTAQQLLQEHQRYGLNHWDSMLLKKMLADGHAWRYRRSTKLLTKSLWRNINYDPWQQPSINKDLHNTSIKALTYNYQELLNNTINS